MKEIFWLKQLQTALVLIVKCSINSKVATDTLILKQIMVQYSNIIMIIEGQVNAIVIPLPQYTHGQKL